MDEYEKVVNIIILEPDNPVLTDVATELAKNIATWKPGKQRRMAVPVKIMLPISY